MGTVHVVTCIDQHFEYHLAMVGVPKHIANIVSKYALSQSHIRASWVREYTLEYFSDFTGQSPPKGRTLCWVKQRRAINNVDAQPKIPFREMYLRFIGGHRYVQ